ncbi:MAG: D-alanyl-D-alanine carboxypeptidase [Sporolactobacillus sp.]|jgi:D-alanyl-D-alanine carboxypeptidase|nr:D-alanyl-D-alanine carboxypeptidase [Sporolactobacillus sp.]
MRDAIAKSLAVLCLVTLIFSLDPGRAGAAVSVSAQSAVLIDQETGRMLYEKNSRQRLPIASITKVMTAVLAVESGKMNRTVTVSRRAAVAEGSSVYLKAGERMKLRDLVYGLLLRSGNDAALAIAEAVGGSERGFALMMNEKARELGMTDTHFMNPSGLHDPDHYSTAADMAALTAYAMENRVFRKIIRTRRYREAATNRSEARLWVNKNKMLRLYRYSTGGKTGFTKNAGRTLISTASRNGLSLIAVTLNDGDDWRDHRHLFEWAFTEFKRTQVLKKGRVKTDGVAPMKGTLRIDRTVYLPLSPAEKRALTKELILIRRPNTAGMRPAGRMIVKIDGRKVADVPVYYHAKKQGKQLFRTIFFAMLQAALSGREQPLI